MSDIYEVFCHIFERCILSINPLSPSIIDCRDTYVKIRVFYYFFEDCKEKIEVLQAKFKKYKDIDDKFYREVNKAYKEKLKPLYQKKVALENSINTATTINDYLYQFKKVLSPYDRTISSLIDFPLNKVFSRVIIHDRDHITFVLGEAGDISTITSMDDDILIRTEPYLIRKTKHLLKYGIYIN